MNECVRGGWVAVAVWLWLAAYAAMLAARSLSGFAVNALTTTCIETTSPSAHLQSEREQQQQKRAAAGGRRSVREERKRRGARESSQSGRASSGGSSGRRGSSPLSGARRPSRVVQRWQRWQQQQQQLSQAAAAQRSPFNILLSSRNRPCQMIFSWPTTGGSEPAGDNIRRVRAGTAEQRIRFDGKHSERTLLRRPFQNRALLDARDAVARVDVEHDRLRQVHAE